VVFSTGFSFGWRVALISFRYFLAILLLGLCMPLAVRAELPEVVDFNFHIKPILSDRCFNCHGPDVENRQGGFRLDLRESAVGEADSGMQPIVPGDAEASEILARITAEDPSMRMPPEESKLSVSEEEIALIRKWIEQGAEWKEHWSFLPLHVAKPQANNTIDLLVQADLKARGLKPVPAATREQLIRRVTYDLTGLPPTLEEVDAFVADQSPDAYEKLVDRLLASPRYGERMAVDWLDVARYADTYGYQADKYRAMWSWRDWVVKAFNENLPFDDFITWQLAGDLLPNATDEQILATAFNRMHRQTNEGGSIEEEFRAEYVVDRVDTFGTAFLGLTVQCARCHDHKFDPISQKDYYQLFAYFDNIDESGLYSHFTSAVPTPTLLQTTPEQEKELAEFDRQIATIEGELQKLKKDAAKPFNRDLRAKKVKAESTGLIGHFAMESIDDKKVANFAGKKKSAKTEGDVKVVPGKVGNGLHLSGENKFSTKVGGDFSRDEPFTISLWINTPDVKDRAVVWHRSQSWTDAGSRGYELLVENGKLNAALIHFWPGNAISVRTVEPVATGQWKLVTVTYDGSSRANGIKIYLDGNQADTEIVRDSLTKTIDYIKRPRANNEGDMVEVDELTLGQRFRDRGFKGGLVDELKIFDRELTALEVANLFDGGAIESGIAKPTSGLLEFYLRNQFEPYREKLAELQKVREAKSQFLDEVPEIMVMREMPKKRQTYLLARGAYDAPSTPVNPETPSGLPTLRDDLPKNRLGLAMWLIDPKHPLTARVTVNRFWQSLFGQGLVPTTNDFGSQGQLPTHPELLDHLASSFIESGWDVKALVKQIVMSDTYQQSSDCDPKLREEDPQNLWLARGPRYRLSAEMIRDTALYLSGLLVEKMGGAPVKPYEPGGLWEEKGSESYVRDEGEGSHRRSLYTFWKRTSPPPAMVTLDAADREVCVVQRQTTATPLQALVLLNDPQYVEAARAAAQSLVFSAQLSKSDRVEKLFRTFTGRQPSEAELELLNRLFNDQWAIFKETPQSAEEFLAIGDHQADKRADPAELAALTIVAEAVMNHYDTVTKQ
jgi:hypothetical protein